MNIKGCLFILIPETGMYVLRYVDAMQMCGNDNKQMYVMAHSKIWNVVEMAYCRLQL